MDSKQDESEVLQSLYVEIEQKLQVDDIKGFLYRNFVLSSNEMERLRIGAQFGTTRDLARELVGMLSAKGGHGASDLLLALEQCAASGYPQMGHNGLILKLKEALLPKQKHNIREDGGAGGGGGWGAQSSHGEREADHITNGDSARTSRVHSEANHAEASNEPIELLQYSKLKGSSRDKERLQVKLAHESQEMLECFTRFVVNLSKLLTSKSVDMETIQLSLQCRLGSCKISDDVIKKIDAASSIPALLRMAMPFSSWYNYNLISFLAKQHGGEEGKMLTAGYEEKLSIYLKRLVYQCPPFSALPSGKFSSDFDELSVKVDWPYKKCTLQDISLFKGKLCKALDHKDPCCFILKSVDEGCVRVTYIIPARLVPVLASRVEQETAELAEERVISIHIGENSVIISPQATTSGHSAGMSPPTKPRSTDESVSQQKRRPDSGGQFDYAPYWRSRWTSMKSSVFTPQTSATSSGYFSETGSQNLSIEYGHHLNSDTSDTFTRTRPCDSPILESEDDHDSVESDFDQ